MIYWLFYECNLLDFCTKWKASLSCDICFSRQEVTVQVNFLILRAHYKITEHIFEPLKNKKNCSDLKIDSKLEHAVLNNNWNVTDQSKDYSELFDIIAIVMNHFSDW